MTRKQGLDDPEIARIAWGRYRRLMGWMAQGGALCVGEALLLLAFLSSGTGHDEQVIDRMIEEGPTDD